MSSKPIFSFKKIAEIPNSFNGPRFRNCHKNCKLVILITFSCRALEKLKVRLEVPSACCPTRPIKNIEKYPLKKDGKS